MRTNKKSRLMVSLALILLVICLASNVYAFRYENDYYSIEPPSGFEKTTKEGFTDNSFFSEYKNGNMTIRIDVEKMPEGEALKTYELNKNLIEDTNDYNGRTVDERSTIGPSDYDIFSAVVKSSRSYAKYYFLATDHYYFTITCRTDGRRQFLYNEKAFDATVKGIEVFDSVTDSLSQQKKEKVIYGSTIGIIIAVIVLVVIGVKKLLKLQNASKASSKNTTKEEKKYNNYEKAKKEYEEKEKPKYTYNPGYNYNFEVGKDNKGSYYSNSDLNKYIKNEENKEDQ